MKLLVFATFVAKFCRLRIVVTVDTLYSERHQRHICAEEASKPVAAKIENILTAAILAARGKAFVTFERSSDAPVSVKNGRKMYVFR